MIGDKIPGWFDEANRWELERLIEKHQVRTVIEIGSFLGLSAIWFAQRVEHVFCVDKWIELEVVPSRNNLVEMLGRWHIPQEFFGIFRQNIVEAGVWDKVTPIRSLSCYAHSVLPDVDLIYIDGDHSQSGFVSDLGLYLPKAKKVICGDDYAPHPEWGVIEVLGQLLPRHQHVGPFWYFEK